MYVRSRLAFHAWGGFIVSSCNLPDMAANAGVQAGSSDLRHDMSEAGVPDDLQAQVFALGYDTQSACRD